MLPVISGGGSAASEEGCIKAALVRAYETALARAPHGQKVRERESFIATYNNGAVWPDIFNALGPLSWQTVERWAAELKKTGDALNLADRRGLARSGQVSVTPEQEQVLLRCALKPGSDPRGKGVPISHAINRARDEMRRSGIDDSPSDATFRRFLDNWSERHFDLWVFHRQGQTALNDECLPWIERDYDKIEVGQLLVADGHDLNFEILNPWTGKAKRMKVILWNDFKSYYPLGWEIMPSENTAAIASAFRRAVLRLGRLPLVAYLDNGKAFCSRFFAGADPARHDGLYERLGIKVTHALKYHGQSKPIERYFKDMAELEEMIPSFTGTSIVNKPPRMSMAEPLHKAVYQKATGGQVITLEQAHLALAWWFDKCAATPHKSGHLQGQRSDLVFEAGLAESQLAPIEPAQLDFLMMGVDERHIFQDGIHLAGRRYWARELYGRRHAVHVRYDLQNRDRVFVYETTGELICEAWAPTKVHPVARHLGTAADVAELSAQMETRNSLMKQTTQAAREFCRDHVIPQVREQMERIEAVAEPLQRPRADVLPLALSPARVSEIEAEAAAMRAVSDDDLIWEKLPGMDDPDRYEELLRLEARGQDLPGDEKIFMRAFEREEYYARHADYYTSLQTSLLSAREETP